MTDFVGAQRDRLRHGDTGRMRRRQQREFIGAAVAHGNAGRRVVRSTKRWAPARAPPVTSTSSAQFLLDRAAAEFGKLRNGHALRAQGAREKLSERRAVIGA